MEHLEVTLAHRSDSLARSARDLAASVATTGRTLALVGVVLPLLMIGVFKFTEIEVEALRPIISGTPWLAWLYAVLGDAGTSYLLGTVEITTAILFFASPWSARAGVAAGVLGSLTSP